MKNTNTTTVTVQRKGHKRKSARVKAHTVRVQKNLAPATTDIKGPSAGPMSRPTVPVNALGITTAYTTWTDRYKVRSLMQWRANPDALAPWQLAELSLADEEFGDGWWVVPTDEAEVERFTSATKRLHESLDPNLTEVSFDDWYGVSYTDAESGIRVDVEYEPDTDEGMTARFDEAMAELKAEVALEATNACFDECMDRFHGALDSNETEVYYEYAPYGEPLVSRYAFTYVDAASGAEIDVEYDPATTEGLTAQFETAMTELKVAACEYLERTRR